jgi:hypothetical protein
LLSYRKGLLAAQGFASLPQLRNADNFNLSINELRVELEFGKLASPFSPMKTSGRIGNDIAGTTGNGTFLR